MNTPTLSRIRIYPIKSLDPVDLTNAEIGVYSLRHDREFAMLASDGRYVNGKRTGRVNQLRAEYDLFANRVSLSDRESINEASTFELSTNDASLKSYLSDFFELDIDVVHQEHGEMMDMPQIASVSIVSKATLESLNADMPEYSLDELRLRFRANLEIDGVSPYWEDRLFAAPGESVGFTLGDVQMIGISPRARCNVPPRNPFTGETDRTFAKRVMASRSKNLPTDSTLEQHGNFYHLAVNTYIFKSESRKSVRIGDQIVIGNSVGLAAT